MKDPLKTFLDERGAKPVDPAPLQRYVAAMIDDVIPEILQDVRYREQLAAELRYARTASVRSHAANPSASATHSGMNSSVAAGGPKVRG